MNLPARPAVKQGGLTLVEVLITLGLVLILAARLPTIYRGVGGSATAGRAANEAAGLLRQVAERANAGLGDANHGLYLDVAGERLVLYRGESYVARDPAFDEPIPWSGGVTLEASGLANGDFNFLSDTGLPKAVGDLVVSDTASKFIISLNRWGSIHVRPFDLL